MPKYLVSLTFKDQANDLHVSGSAKMEVDADDEGAAESAVLDRAALCIPWKTVTVEDVVELVDVPPDGIVQLEGKERQAIACALGYAINHLADFNEDQAGTWSAPWLASVVDKVRRAGTRVTVGLRDQGNRDRPPVPGWIELENGAIAIGVEGYGDMTSEIGHGTPVYLEILDGQLRLVVWADINQEEPTHVLSLETARESLYKESDES